jgi:hypothetical protein
MAGLQVVVTKCDENGNVDMADLQAKCEQHSANLACRDDHLPQHARRVRNHGEGPLRAGAPPWRSRVRGRRQHERAGRRGRAGRIRRRREPPEPAQDLLHPARRRRPGRRALCAWSKTWCRILPGHATRPAAFPAAWGPSALPRWATRPCCRFQLDVHPHDGRRRPAARHRSRHPGRQLHQQAPERPLPHALRQRTAMWPTNASWTCAA